MEGETLPVVGAAMPIAMLRGYQEWILAEQRDLEIQDAIHPDVLDGDWTPLVREARAVLNGYSGQLGLHGPFDGLTLMSHDREVRALVSDRLRKALAFGAELGATHMVIHSPFIFFGDSFLPHSSSTGLSEQIALIQATLEPLLPLAREANCTLVIENILRTQRRY